MAQTSTVTSTPGNLAMTPSAISAMIVDVQSRVGAGLPVLASDLLNIQQMYNAFITHTHTVLDYSYVAYGNLPAYGTTTQIDTTAAPALSPLALTATPGTSMLAATQFSLATGINSMGTHGHTITDHLLP